MKVKVDDEESFTVDVTSGVPQGSVKGPILFIIYKNYLVAKLSCNCKIFADDIKHFLEIPDGDMQTAVRQCQADIDHLVKTSESWGLHMNAEKCTVLRFKPRGSLVASTGKSPYHIILF